MTDPRPFILVAEDEPLASMALRVQLEALDYRVLGPARDGDDAIALGACFPLDIALFDFRMPRRNGIEAAQALFEIAPTPVVLLTGIDVNSLPDPIPRPPVFGTLTKPADLDELRKALNGAANAFQSWLQAEPARMERVLRLRQERHTIAAAVTARAGESPPARVAARFLEQARQEGRPVIEIARHALVPED